MERIVRYPVIELVLEKPVNGYWDGGAKSSFEFSPTFFDENSDLETSSKQFKPKDDIRWGSFSANFFFSTKSGRNWKEAISLAKRKIIRLYSGGSKIKEINIFWRENDEL